MSGKDLEASLREGAEPVAQGRIKVDDRRALERLRLHRLADPSHWVLEVLRAATLSRATKVSVTTSAREVVVRFNGQSFPAAIIDDLLHHALRSDARGDEERARLLALGVAGALGAGARRVEVTSGGRRAQLTPPEGFTVTAQALAGTEVRLVRSFTPGLAMNVLRGAPEARAVRERCRAYDAELWLDGKRVNQVEPFDLEVVDVVEKKVGEGKVLVAMPLAALPASQLELDVLGVQVSTLQVKLPGLQVLARARGDQMQRDASGSSVVESDGQLKAFRRALRAAWLELLERRVNALPASESGEAQRWRHRLTQLALEHPLPKDVEAVLRRAPLLGGPAGEWYSVAELAAGKSGSINVSYQHCPEGTYPRPTVYLGLHQVMPWQDLVPEGKRRDVATLVASKLKAAQVREVWARQPEEAAWLEEGDWVARAPLESPALEGEVGLEPGLNAASVRLLCRGRAVQHGPAVALAPLRLHAVVNLKRELTDAEWVKVPDASLFRSCLPAVEKAATEAIADGLARPEPSEAALQHGADLLMRLIGQGKGRAALPSTVVAAPLFSWVGGGRTSLHQLETRPRCLFVTAHFTQPLLSGEPVLALTPELLEALRALVPQKLVDARDWLVAEADVRQRLRRPQSTPRVQVASTVVPVVGEGVQGELGLLSGTARQLELTLMRQGIVLERTTLTSRYGAVEAVVGCDALAPNPVWNKAVRDAAFERVVTAVRAAEKRLAHRLVERFVTLEQMEAAAQRYVLDYLGKAARPDTLDQAFLALPMFPSATGPLSFTALAALIAGGKRLWVLPANSRTVAPGDLPLVRLEFPLAHALAELLGVVPEDATPELERRAQRAAFLTRPMLATAFSGEVPFAVRMGAPGLDLVAGLADGVTAGARVSVRVLGREYSALLVELEALLPLVAIVDLTEADPAAPMDPWLQNREAVQDLLDEAALKVLGLALESLEQQGPANEAARRATWVAAGASGESELPAPMWRRLRERVMLPCTDGQPRSLVQLGGLEVLKYVTRLPPAEEAASRRSPTGPIVLAEDQVARAALRHWPKRHDVTQALADEARERALLRARKPVEAVRLGPVLLRRPLTLAGAEGEVGLAPPGEEGRVTVYTERRLLTMVEGALPPPFVAAVNLDGLEPGPSGQVPQDARWKDAVSALLFDANALADDAVALWEKASGSERAELAPALVPLAFWVAAQTPRHPLVFAEVLECSDGRSLAVGALLAQKKARKPLLVSSERGALFDESAWVWCPRPGEQLRATPLKLELKDGTAALLKAAEVRARPKVAEVSVGLLTPWREPIVTSALRGEVALPPLPTGQLVVDVLHQRSVLEHWVTDHPLSGVAMVDVDDLTPNGDWTRAQRNRAFTTMAGEVTAALERLVARRLSDGPRDGAWRQWAQAAVHWYQPTTNSPLAELVPRLACLADLSGALLTVGEVLAQAQRHKRVALAPAGLPRQEELVLVDTPETRAMLQSLKVAFEDVTAELQHQAQLSAGRRARRLSALAWEGPALVRRAVKVGALSGELVLPRTPDHEAVVTLAREFIGVCPWPEASAAGMAGVLDTPNLSVNEGWTRGSLTLDEALLARAEVDAVWLALAAGVPRFNQEEREAARTYALGALTAARVTSCPEVRRLAGPLGALAAAPLFRTVDGRWVDLKTLAAEVEKRKRVPVLARRLLAPAVGGALVLEAVKLDAEWLIDLDRVLGKGSLKRLTDLKQWRQAQAEADPQQGTPQKQGLERLRRELRLLREGSLGHLKPDDLEEVLVVRGEARRLIHYDAKRRVVLLDGESELVRRTLAEVRQRPERLYALVAAIYGEVNRVLERITDQDEAQLLLGLCGHLAANPGLLEPRSEAGGDERSTASP